MNKKGLLKLIGSSIAVIFLLLVPLFTRDPYYLQILDMIFLNVILAASFYTIASMGQLSLAHAAFMGIGAYTSALLVMRVGLSFWIAFPLAGIIALIVALLIGYPTLRIKGAYFLLITFAFGEVVMLLFHNFFTDIFGGAAGITNVPPPDPIHIPYLPVVEFVSAGSMYSLILVVTIVSLLFLYRVNRSRVGMTFHAISETETLSECIGINLMRYRIIAFIIGCFFAALAGSLYAHLFSVVTTADFGVSRSIFILVYLVVGGMNSFGGPILGTLILTLISDLLLDLAHYQALAFGVILIVVMLFMPSGIIGLPNQISSWWRRRAKSKEARKGYGIS
jgi:branched-chain amino acid transport system permease protein